ncbi:MAG TPA: shikimate dehydrogenase [Candidatus Sulfotelmatobacter sp.]|jgi:shikimate dehydrogenase|nr:shikimate dehydrogenase [Candidatus Sulfotelmatobacter sp.]
MILSGRAKLAGVMGWPVGHSRSPRLHGFWLQSLGIDGAYLPLPVKPEDFESVFRALPRMGFAGANVTVPHKEAAMILADEVEPLARRIGAVNTLVVRSDGSILGRNTDAFGFIENLRQGAAGFSAARGPAVVLGAGGAARAVIAALQDDGCPDIRLLNRTRARAEEVAQALGGKVTVLEWDARAAALEGAALLVNTTTLGMTGQQPLDLPLDALPPDALVTDIVYAPLMTDLLARAQARGNRLVDGLGMLLHQARPGFQAWFGVMPEVTGELRTFVGEL